MATHREPVCGMQIEGSEAAREVGISEKNVLLFFDRVQGQVRGRPGKIFKSINKSVGSKLVCPALF